MKLWKLLNEKEPPDFYRISEIKVHLQASLLRSYPRVPITSEIDNCIDLADDFQFHIASMLRSLLCKAQSLQQTWEVIDF